jgi:hypothetical protein
VIRIAPPTEAPNERAMADLRAMASSRSTAAEKVHRIQRDSESIVATMKAIHGGQWSIAIDHEDCFVLIARDLPACP